MIGVVLMKGGITMEGEEKEDEGIYWHFAIKQTPQITPQHTNQLHPPITVQLPATAAAATNCVASSATGCG